MLIDSSALDCDALLECDLCIIGAGAAGLSLALGMLNHPYKIVVVDAGGAKMGPDAQDFYQGETSSPSHAPPHMYRQRRLGGSTAIWGGRCVPLDEQDFFTRDHVPLSGWPFAKSELDKYYIGAQKILEAGAFDYSAKSSLADGSFIEGFKDSEVLIDSLERFSPPTNMWMRYKNELTQQDQITVVSHGVCTRLKANGAHSAIEEASFVGRNRKAFQVRARFFVCAVGGLEIVRLLGVSKIGNDHDMLGRTYMCHIESALGTIRLAPSNRSIKFGFERTLDGIYARRRFTLKARAQRKHGILNAAIRLHHPSVPDPGHGQAVLSAMFLTKRFIIPEYGRKFAMPELVAMQTLQQQQRFWSAHGRNLIMGLGPLSAFTAGWVWNRYLKYRKVPYVALSSANGVYNLDFNGEQAPNLESRVTLTDKVDAFGLPRLRIDWRMTDLDVKTASTTLRELRRSFAESGCGTVEFNDATLDEDQRRHALPVGGHHIGTARMSTDPRLGLVTPDTRVHGMENLYVAGSATFPTSGQANPTLTIVAMALRLATHLDTRLGASSRG